MSEEQRAIGLMRATLRRGIEGSRAFHGSNALAEHTRRRLPGVTDDIRIQALIRPEANRNAVTGFVTGLGGLLTLPITLPTGLGLSWMIQARLVGAISALSGHDVHRAEIQALSASILSQHFYDEDAAFPADEQLITEGVTAEVALIHAP